MRIANAEIDGRPRVVVSQADTQWIELPASSIQQLLDDGGLDPARIRQAVSSGQIIPEDRLRFRAPFARPGQIIALARNYSAHAKESTLPVPHAPIFFSKSNTSVIGPGDAVVLPPNLGRIEPEIELAFVIGRRASHVPASAAAEYIAGYTILNDVSAQQLQAREIQEHYPLFRCKSLATFTPMGPWLVTVDEIGTAPALDMRLRVNGEVRVVTNTSGLTFGIARLLEFISGYVVLMPGDVITTGCPKAAGAILPGDELELEVEKIGILHNPVVLGTETCPT